MLPKCHTLNSPAGPVNLVAADLAVYLVVRPDGHGGDVHGALARPAAQALLVVGPPLDDLLLRLED